MGSITLIPALAAAAVARVRGFRRAWVFVALPALVLLPNYYVFDLRGLPEATFHNYLLVVVGAALLLGKDQALYRFQRIDLIPLAFAVWLGVSEALTHGFQEARNLFALQAMLVCVPWALGRALAKHESLLIASLVMLGLLGGFIGLLSPYEARLGRNPFDLLRGVWPNWVPWDGALYRGGLRRVAGPFAHPICLGFFYTMILPLVVWLGRARLVPAPAFWFMFGGSSLGLLLTLSRGPIASAALAIALMLLLWTEARRSLFGSALLLMVPLALVLAPSFASYVSVGRSQAGSATQETAAYRKEMIDNYLPVVEESPWIGHGKQGFPIVEGQTSIDNQFLLLALEHGSPATLLFTLLLVVPVGLLLAPLGRRPAQDIWGRLGWALVATLIGALATQTTVFSGPQSAQVMVLLAGLAAGFSARLKQLPIQEASP